MKAKMDHETERMSRKILKELETATSGDLSKTEYAKKMLFLADIDNASGVLQEIRDTTRKNKRRIEKKAVIRVLLYSTWLHRLYFIIRAALMGLIGFSITIAFVAYLGTINVWGEFFLSIFVFTAGLIITRFFDVQLINITKNIVKRLANHKHFRNFIMDHF